MATATARVERLAGLVGLSTLPRLTDKCLSSVLITASAVPDGVSAFVVVWFILTGLPDSYSFRPLPQGRRKSLIFFSDSSCHK